MNEFFAELGSLLTKAARDRGVEMASPILDEGTASELLDLARVAAQVRERRFAPLSCYLAGTAVERLRSGRGELTSEEEAAYLKAVRQSLESLSAPE